MDRREFNAASAFFALLVLLPGSGCGRRKPRLPRIEDSGVILAFGDSLTYGTGATPDESYPAVLERLTSRHVVRSGVPGETAGEGLGRLPAVLAETAPQLMILCLGGNDLIRRGDESALKESLRRMIRLARDRGTVVVLLAPPRPGLFADSPPLYAELAQEFGAPLEADILKKVLMDNSLKSDLIHPNAKGYARIAEALAQLLKDTGAL